MMNDLRKSIFSVRPKRFHESLLYSLIASFFYVVASVFWLLDTSNSLWFFSAFLVLLAISIHNCYCYSLYINECETKFSQKMKEVSTENLEALKNSGTLNAWELNMIKHELGYDDENQYSPIPIRPIF